MWGHIANENKNQNIIFNTSTEEGRGSMVSEHELIDDVFALDEDSVSKMLMHAVKVHKYHLSFGYLRVIFPCDFWFIRKCFNSLSRAFA